MALIHKTKGYYLRITSINTANDTVDYNIYRNAQIREDEKNGVVSEYEIIKNGCWNTAVVPEVVLQATPDSTKNLLDNLKTQSYINMLLDTSAFGDYESDGA